MSNKLYGEPVLHDPEGVLTVDELRCKQTEYHTGLACDHKSTHTEQPTVYGITHTQGFMYGMAVVFVVALVFCGVSFLVDKLWDDD